MSAEEKSNKKKALEEVQRLVLQGRLTAVDRIASAMRRQGNFSVVAKYIEYRHLVLFYLSFLSLFPSDFIVLYSLVFSPLWLYRLPSSFLLSPARFPSSFS